MGSVLRFYTSDGEPKRVLVLDAQYRTIKRFGTRNKNVLPNYNTYPSLGNYLNPSTGAAKTATSVTLCKSLSEELINSIWKDSIDQNSSKQNCDEWMKYVDTSDTNISSSSYNVSIKGVPCVQYCRDISVNGTPCDLPNIQTLIRIYCEADQIDALDPTISKYPKFALGTKNTQGAWKFGTSASSTDVLLTAAYSSTQANINCMRYISSTGTVAYVYKCYEMGVIPVLEL